MSADGLALVLLGDSVFNLVPNTWLRQDLDRLGLPYELRFVLAGAKASGGLGLLARRRSRRLARLAATGLVGYFGLAVVAHARVGDDASKYVPAALLLGWSVVTAARLGRTATE